MLGRGVFGVLGIVVASGLLAGCTSRELSGRWGPDPTLPSTDVDTVIKNQTQVLAYIAENARIIQKDEDGIYTKMNDKDWYRVAEWGFNVGRQDCEVYLDELFRMNRRKQRNDGIFAGFNTATAAVLTATASSSMSLSILAAAFGLSKALNDSIFDSYMFTEAPGLVANKVKALQDTYRNTVRDGMKENPNLISTPEAAYNAIQNYYQICLPHSIEGTLLQAVADTTATAPSPAGGTSQGSSGAATRTPASAAASASKLAAPSARPKGTLNFSPTLVQRRQ